MYVQAALSYQQPILDRIEAPQIQDRSVLRAQDLEFGLTPGKVRRHPFFAFFLISPIHLSSHELPR
jgi:hypothetical protein